MNGSGIIRLAAVDRSERIYVGLLRGEDEHRRIRIGIDERVEIVKLIPALISN